MKGVYKMILKIGKHELIVVKEPELKIYYEKGIMAVIIHVEDENGKKYELHYVSGLDDPDLIVTDSLFDESAEVQ